MAIQSVFTVMSFGKEGTPIFDEGIKPTVEALGLASARVDRQQSLNPITRQIVDGLRHSYFVIAEMSRERPNCYYEVGYAHALGRPVILLIDSVDKIHFDIHDFPFIVYDDVPDLRRKLTERIVGAVLTQHAELSQDDPHCRKFGGCALRNGRLLMAKVTSTSRNSAAFHLQVSSVPGAPTLTGNIRFFLHEEFKYPEVVVRAVDGVATLDISALGAFTVGAKADGGSTSLELNLARIPGANQKFYTR